MPSPNFLAAQSYALSRLQDELDPRLVYHDVKHTRDIVLPSARQLAEDSQLADEGKLLLFTAAIFHDIGFVQSREEHEEHGIDIAAQALPNFEYSDDQIARIATIIRATKLPQIPRDKLGEILADADLSILAHPDFLSYNLALRQERANFGDYMSDFVWFDSQHNFVSNHQYFTDAARRRYEANKAEAIRILAEQRDAAR